MGGLVKKTGATWLAERGALVEDERSKRNFGQICWPLGIILFRIQRTSLARSGPDAQPSSLNRGAQLLGETRTTVFAGRCSAQTFIFCRVKSFPQYTNRTFLCRTQLARARAAVLPADSQDEANCYFLVGRKLTQLRARPPAGCQCKRGCSFCPRQPPGHLSRAKWMMFAQVVASN